MTELVVARPRADIALPRYDDMCRAIAECHAVDEVKDIRDKAEALRAYARQANNREAEVQFAECKVRAEIRAGELLREMAENGQRKSQGDATLQRERSSLKDLGVSEIESHRFQAAAMAAHQLPYKVEETFAEARRTQIPVTSAQVRALTKTPDFTPAQRADHERLWRVLRALEQISDQDIMPEDWVASLPDYMAARVATVVPFCLGVAHTWLGT